MMSGWVDGEWIGRYGVLNKQVGRWIDEVFCIGRWMVRQMINGNDEQIRLVMSGWVGGWMDDGE